MSATTQLTGRGTPSSARPRPVTLRRDRRGGGWATYLVLGIAVVLSLFPLYWMFVVATNGSAAATRIPPALVPGGQGPHVLRGVFTQMPTFGRAIVNSAVVSVCVAALQVLTSTLAGFAFAKLRFPGRNALFVVVLLTLMVPGQLGVVPLYLEMSRLGWVDTLQAVIVPSAASAFGVFWMRQYIESAIPDELVEAARMDGCRSFRVYRSIVLPNIRGGASVLGLFAFMYAWNDFLWPLIVLNSPEHWTAQVAIKQLQATYYIDYGLTMGGTVLATIPVLLVFVLAGRQLVGGIMEGALRG